jgi:hypothetical protein
MRTSKLSKILTSRRAVKGEDNLSSQSHANKAFCGFNYLSTVRGAMTWHHRLDAAGRDALREAAPMIVADLAARPIVHCRRGKR